MAAMTTMVRTVISNALYVYELILDLTEAVRSEAASAP